MKFSVFFLVFFVAVCTFSEAGDPVHAEYDVQVKGIRGYNKTQATVDLDKDNQFVTATVLKDLSQGQFLGGFSYFDVKNNFAILRSDDATCCRVNVPTTAPVTMESAESLLVAPVLKEYVGYDAAMYTNKSDQTNQPGVLPIVYCEDKQLDDRTTYNQEVQDAMAKYCPDATIMRDLTNCTRRGGLWFSGWYCVSAGVMATPQGLQLSCLTLDTNFGK